MTVPLIQQAASRISYVERTYGIPYEEYERMVEALEGRCAICLRLPKKHLSIDHDHKTGKVRGLLCSGCNAGIGLLRDDVWSVFDAWVYLLQGTPPKEFLA